MLLHTLYYTLLLYIAIIIICYYYILLLYKLLYIANLSTSVVNNAIIGFYFSSSASDACAQILWGIYHIPNVMQVAYAYIWFEMKAVLLGCLLSLSDEM